MIRQQGVDPPPPNRRLLYQAEPLTKPPPRSVTSFARVVSRRPPHRHPPCVFRSPTLFSACSQHTGCPACVCSVCRLSALFSAIAYSIPSKAAYRVRFVLDRALQFIGLWSPTEIGLLLGLGLWSPKANRALTWTRALESKGKSDSSLDSGSGVRARSDSGLDSDSWFARAWGFVGGYRHFSAGIGIGKGQPPPQDKEASRLKRAVECAKKSKSIQTRGTTCMRIRRRLPVHFSYKRQKCRRLQGIRRGHQGLIRTARR
jgi:hypothetical protein